MTVWRMKRSVPHLWIAVFGEEWTGRSSAGNTILGRSEFSVDGTPEPLTLGTGFVEGSLVTVVNTRGWEPGCSPDIPLRILREGCRCVSCRTGHGLHALLLTVPICTNLNWNQKTAKRLLKLFDDHTWRHTILLFTRADLLDSSGLEGYLKGAGLPLQTLVEKCERRFHSLNNRNRENRKQVRELLAKIDQMVEENDGKTFQLLDSKKEEEAMVVNQSEVPRNTVQVEQLKEMSEHQAKLEEKPPEWKKRPEDYTFGSLKQGEECSVLFLKQNNEARHQLEMQDTPLESFNTRDECIEDLIDCCSEDTSEMNVTILNTFGEPGVQESEVEEVKVTATDCNFSKIQNKSCVDSVTRLYNKSCGEFGPELLKNIEKLKNQQEMAQREFTVNQTCEEQRNQSVDGSLSNDESEEIGRHYENEVNKTDIVEELTMMGQLKPQNGIMKDNDFEDFTSKSMTDALGVLQTPDKADGNGSVRTNTCREVEETHRDKDPQDDKPIKYAKNENWMHMSPTKDATELNIFGLVSNCQNDAVRINVLQVLVCFVNPDPHCQTVWIFFSICYICIDQTAFVIQFLFVTWLIKNSQTGAQNEDMLMFPVHKQQSTKETQQKELREDSSVLSAGSRHWPGNLGKEILQHNVKESDEGKPKHSRKGNNRGITQLSKNKSDRGIPQHSKKENNRGVTPHSKNGSDKGKAQQSKKEHHEGIPKHSIKESDGISQGDNKENNIGITQQSEEKEEVIHSEKRSNRGVGQHIRNKTDEVAYQGCKKEGDQETPRQSRKENDEGIREHSRKGNNRGITQLSKNGSDRVIHQHSKKENDRGVTQHSKNGRDKGKAQHSRNGIGIAQHNRKIEDRSKSEHRRWGGTKNGEEQMYKIKEITKPRNKKQKKNRLHKQSQWLNTGSKDEKEEAPRERCQDTPNQRISSKQQLNGQGDRSDARNLKRGERTCGRFRNDPSSAQTDDLEEFGGARKTQRGQDQSLERTIKFRCDRRQDEKWTMSGDDFGGASKTRRSRSLVREIRLSFESDWRRNEKWTVTGEESGGARKIRLSQSLDRIVKM